MPALLGTRIPMAALVQAVAVAEHLNFTHAAAVLGITQSSVSMRIKALEEDLGILLFERRPRGVRLTEAGRYFVEQVAHAIDQLDHAVQTAGMVARGECGNLRIGVHALIPGSFLDKLIERYRERYRGIEVEIAEGAAREGVMRIREDRLDLTFVAGAPEIPDCNSRHLWSERLLVALPSRHPLCARKGVTWADLASETFLVRQGGTGPQVHNHIIRRLAGRFPPPRIQRFNVERMTLLSMVAQGYGVTIVGEATEQMHAPNVTFLPVIDEPEPVAFSAVWSPTNRNPALRNLLTVAERMRREGARRPE